MSYYVYILRSTKTGKHYSGSTGDVQRRIKEHNRGATKSLRKHLPLEIVKLEEYATKALAATRERQIKSYKGGEAFKRLIK